MPRNPLPPKVTSFGARYLRATLAARHTAPLCVALLLPSNTSGLVSPGCQLKWGKFGVPLERHVSRFGFLHHRFSGGKPPCAANSFACSSRFTGLCFTFVLAGWAPRKLSLFQFFDGRIGLGTKPPPQFGHVFFRMVSTQVAQKVHSYVQMRASVAAGGNALLQCSQIGLSSSMTSPFLRLTQSSAAPRCWGVRWNAGLGTALSAAQHQTSGSETSTSLSSLSLKWKLAVAGFLHMSLSFEARPKVGTPTVIFTSYEPFPAKALFIA